MFIGVGGIVLLYVFSVSAQSRINPCVFALCPYGSQCESYLDCSTKVCTRKARCIRPLCMKDGLKCSSAGECCSGCCYNGKCTKYDDSICSPCCNTKCELFFHCAEQKILCKKAPCLPLAVCVKDPPDKYNATLKCSKPEKLQLKSECNQKEEDCQVCGTVPKCKCPIEKYENNPCCGVQCKRGSRCALKHGFCFRDVCSLQPVCVKNPPANYKPINQCAINEKLDFRSQCGDEYNSCEICTTPAPKCYCPKKVENPCCRLNCEPGSRCALERAFCFDPPCAPLPVCAKNLPVNYNATITCEKDEQLQLNSGCNDKERNCEICVKPTQQCLDKPPVAINNPCCCTQCECGSHCALSQRCLRLLGMPVDCSSFPICIKDSLVHYNTTLYCQKPYRAELRSGCNVTEGNCEICTVPAPKCIGKFNCPIIQDKNPKLN